MTLGPQFGKMYHATPEYEMQPAPNWDYRMGHGAKHMDNQDHIKGQRYLFRPVSEDEKFAHEQGEYAKRNRALAEREGYRQSMSRATMHVDGPIAAALPAEHWPPAGETTQHGEYTVAHFPSFGGVAAFKGSQPVARLQMPNIADFSGRRTENRVVGFVETDQRHQRQGLGRAMWHLGQQVTQAETSGRGELRHDIKRTPDGEKFAKAVGGNNMFGQPIEDDDTWTKK